ncbi:MAG TPA: organic hydroperoxide resistance protein [Pseudosphingobacterium sp.]|nr:organic hydroperoxide resistance protein [Pseudosphingobacterium sp.]
MENSNKASQVDAQNTKVVYIAKAHTVGGRDGGSSHTSDGRLDVKLSLPGAPGNGTNPEQLFAVGWSSCFFSALKLEAATRKVRFPADAAVDAEVDLRLSEKDGYSLEARLNISLPGIEPELAVAIAEGAHLLCPYSKATHGNIKVETNIV